MKNPVRAIIYAPVSARAAWIAKELASESIAIGNATDVKNVLASVFEQATRPQILVVDFDALSGAEVLELHALRERGWFGTIFALGKVPADLRKSLRIEQVIGTLVDTSLRTAVAEIGFDAKTRRLPIFDR